jgi:hypothetical protein
MTQEFVPYELAVKLKELGFDEPCMAIYYSKDKSFSWHHHKVHTNDEPALDSGEFNISAPLYQQAFRWFREKYNIYAIILPSYADDKVVKDRFFYEIANGRKLNQELNYHNTYEEAELACLEKLIEIVENEKTL